MNEQTVFVVLNQFFLRKFLIVFCFLFASIRHCYNLALIYWDTLIAVFKLNAISFSNIEALSFSESILTLAFLWNLSTAERIYQNSQHFFDVTHTANVF